MYKDLYRKPLKRDWVARVVMFFPYKPFCFSAGVAVDTFETYGSKFTGYLSLICSFSSG